jgi:hypothetical protein
LAKIDGKAFTVIKVEDSNYTQGDESTKGVKITTKETFVIEGTSFNKFHTTRIAVVNKLATEAGYALSERRTLKVKCVSEMGKNGKSFFNLKDA